MTTSTTHPLTHAAVLAGLLERLESRGPADAGQYRDVAARLARELADVPHDAALENLLNVSPAASAVYENIQYAAAGLCRAPIDVAVAAELRAREAIARARRSEGAMPPRAA
ncbi:hypothetical protein [Xylophilus sp.]|uniref:hypothetical protein n=1 Tax=Xylophilus sp. TaxID=2653893 RepID=UPI0013B88898|nr:hypothetical protein [Xylophilus sp.]KAF1047054.1 MAG: hypothetical protein GAK38_02098 [Xylophilus sp.]